MTDRSNDMPRVPSVAGVRHRYLTVRGARMHLAEAGPSDAPTVVLLHGFPQHWYAWRGIMPLLAADFHVVAVDLPGFGWSEASMHGYSTSERSLDVISLLDELGLTDVDIVGHDWGAWLAFRVALDAPERVRHLVSVSELHPWPLQRRLVPRLWRMWVTVLFELPGLGVRVQQKQRIIRWFLSRDAVDSTTWTEKLVRSYSVPAYRPTTAHAGQRMHFEFVKHDITRLVFRRDGNRHYATPTLLVTGDRDSYIPAALLGVPRRRADTLRVETVSGGHFILDENPAEVGAAIRSHLTPSIVGGRQSAFSPAG